MARLVLILLLTVGLAAPPALRAQESSRAGRAGDKEVSSGSVVRLDSNLVFTPPTEDDPLAFRFQSNTARPLSAYLSTSADRFYGFERYKLSRLECAWEGAGMGMTLGMIAGAAGMASGLFDEEESLYAVGAAMALGALFGAMKADDPNFSVRLRFEPADYDRR
jgi:hypothetical protein